MLWNVLDGCDLYLCHVTFEMLWYNMITPNWKTSILRWNQILESKYNWALISSIQPHNPYSISYSSNGVSPTNFNSSTTSIKIHAGVFLCWWWRKKASHGPIFNLSRNAKNHLLWQGGALWEIVQKKHELPM